MRSWAIAGLGWAVVCSIVLLGAGCGKKPPKPVEKEMVWPAPPEDPRIKWVTCYYSSDDLGKSGFQAFLDTATGKSGGTRLVKPYGIYVDAQNRIYVSDAGPGKVFVFDPRERSVHVIGTSVQGRLVKPIEITGDREGNLYITDGGDQQVKSFGPAPGYELRWAVGKSGEFHNPSGIAVHEATHRLWVTDTKNHRLRALDLDGNFRFEVGGPGTGSGQFNLPSNLAVDQQRNEIYVVDTMNFRVQVLDQDGAFLRQFGCVGDNWGCFARPRGIALDREGHVYVSDALFNNVQIFTPEGKLLLYFSNMGTRPGELQVPAGLAFGADDRLYVADQLNRRIAVFQYLKQKE